MLFQRHRQFTLWERVALSQEQVLFGAGTPESRAYINNCKIRKNVCVYLFVCPSYRRCPEGEILPGGRPPGT